VNQHGFTERTAWIHGKNGSVKVSKNLDRHRSENYFITLSK